jgi:hypothetical protein
MDITDKIASTGKKIIVGGLLLGNLTGCGKEYNIEMYKHIPHGQALLENYKGESRRLTLEYDNGLKIRMIINEKGKVTETKFIADEMDQNVIYQQALLEMARDMRENIPITPGRE